MEKELWKYLQTAKKPIVLYGMGNGADKIINVLDFYGIPVSGVFASDGFVREKYFHSHKVVSYSAAKEKFGDMIVLLCFGSQLPEVMENILKIAAEQELYAPEVPVIGGGLFTEEYYLNNKPSFDRVYSRLCDDISKKTFENIINYKISGKIDYLLECQVETNEPYDSFLKLEKENFIDLGAYNGDTVLQFVKNCPDYTHITAVEPDFKTFKKLKANTENLCNIELVNACVSDKCGKAFFDMKGGRNSSIGNGTETDCITVDSLNSDATFIKMDVEGEEIGAIKGAAKTIINNKPKMLISAYHRTEDLISIPETVLGINPEYKMYIRHFPYLPAWDTNFYFI